MKADMAFIIKIKKFTSFSVIDNIFFVQLFRYEITGFKIKIL